MAQQDTAAWQAGFNRHEGAAGSASRAAAAAADGSGGGGGGSNARHRGGDFAAQGLGSYGSGHGVPSFTPEGYGSAGTGGGWDHADYPLQQHGSGRGGSGYSGAPPPKASGMPAAGGIQRGKPIKAGKAAGLPGKAPSFLPRFGKSISCGVPGSSARGDRSSLGKGSQYDCAEEEEWGYGCSPPSHPEGWGPAAADGTAAAAGRAGADEDEYDSIYANQAAAAATHRFSGVSSDSATRQPKSS